MKWSVAWPGSISVPFFAGANGDWIRATPAFDGESLFVAGMRDVLVCLDSARGKERWRVDFVERFKSTLPTFGFVSSPLVDGTHVYVQAGGSFVKLSKRNGETAWRSLEDGGGMNQGDRGNDRRAVPCLARAIASPRRKRQKALSHDPPTILSSSSRGS